MMVLQSSRQKSSQCPLGLIPHFYDEKWEVVVHAGNGVNALSGLYLISTAAQGQTKSDEKKVSMPSRAYTSFLPMEFMLDLNNDGTVSMPSRAYTSFLPKGAGNRKDFWCLCVNALSGLYLISTVPFQKPRFYAVSRACFCRYLSEYSDNSHFSYMLTFWTYLMRCTYP